MTGIYMPHPPNMEDITLRVLQGAWRMRLYSLRGYASYRAAAKHFDIKKPLVSSS